MKANSFSSDVIFNLDEKMRKLEEKKVGNLFPVPYLYVKFANTCKNKKSKYLQNNREQDGQIQHFEK